MTLGGGGNCILTEMVHGGLRGRGCPQARVGCHHLALGAWLGPALLGQGPDQHLPHSASLHTLV